MDTLQITAHIAAKTDVKNHMERLWTSIVVLNQIVGLSESTMKELNAKISVTIAECDISIRDHSKLLSDLDGIADIIETEHEKSIEDLKYLDNHPQL